MKESRELAAARASMAAAEAAWESADGLARLDDGIGRLADIIDAGSVAVAGVYTGIYPLASPGGWHLIGRAAGAALFDPTRHPPARFAPGDRVRFVRG